MWFPIYIPVFKTLPLVNSFDTINTGYLNYLSLIFGFVTPSKSTLGAENVKVPKFGITIPLPILIYLEIYKPNDPQTDPITSSSINPSNAYTFENFPVLEAVSIIFYDAIETLD